MQYKIPNFKLKLVKEKTFKKAPVIDSQHAGKIAVEILAKQQSDRENMWVLLLDTKNRVIGWNLIAVGAGNQCVIAMPVLFRIVFMSGATGFILYHNHPSGDLTASHGDIDITRQVRKLAKELEVSCLDHIICSSEGRWVSMADTIGLE